MVPLPTWRRWRCWCVTARGRLWQELAKNPLIIATLAGLAFNLSGAQSPAPVVPFLQRLADAAVTLGLLAVGAALRLGRSEGGRFGTLYLCAVKLVALPAVAWGLGRALGLEGVAFQVAVAFAALPTASSAWHSGDAAGATGPAWHG